MDMDNIETPDYFPELSRKVRDLINRVRDALFRVDSQLCLRLMAECSALQTETRKAEADCNANLLVGMTDAEDRLQLVRCAQRCSRLGRIVHQALQIVQNVHEIADQIEPSDIEAFKPIYLMAEVELQDAVLSILRDDERLAYGVRSKDEELDQMYAKEMERIFHNTSSAMFYNFHTGTSLLFILRAIERIGDHAKELAIPSFYLLTAGGRCVGEKRRAI